MKPLHKMTYKEFGKLRFLDFFPRTKKFRADHSGGLETGIGLACQEGYGFMTGFTSPADSNWQTAEMQLYFEGNDCPELEGHALLEPLGLNLRCGMASKQIKQAIGTPEEQSKRWLRFIVGTKYPFYVGCLIGDKGLCRVWICRKDLADKQMKRESGRP